MGCKYPNGLLGLLPLGAFLIDFCVNEGLLYVHERAVVVFQSR